MSHRAAFVFEIPEYVGDQWIAEASRRLSEEHSAVILKGRPPVFCKGYDLIEASQCTDQREAQLTFRAFAELLRRLSSGPWPVLAVVDGESKGAGVGLAAVADIVIADPRATFQLPEVLWGLIPAAVLPAVARRTGWAVARRMALAEPAISGEEAHRLGLVDVVSQTPEDELDRRLSRLGRADYAAISALRELAEKGWPAEEAFTAVGVLRVVSAARRIRRYLDGEVPWECSA